METVNSISPILFKDASLFAVEYSCWTGATTPKDEDIEIMGVQSLDKQFFTKGSMQLISKEALKPFTDLRNRCKLILDSLHDGPFGKSKFVKNEDFRDRISPFMKESKQQFALMIDRFIDVDYPAEKASRIELFNQNHPEYSGRLDKYFPSTQDVRKKFGFAWNICRIENVEAIDIIMEEERDSLRRRMQSFVHELADDFRKTAVSAALAFRKGIDRAKGKVDDRAVAAFRGFLDRMDREDFLGDQEMKDTLSRMKDRVFDIQDWSTKDKNALNEIRSYLDEVVRVGEQEGAASGVASDFLRTVSIPDQEIDAEDLAPISEIQRQIAQEAAVDESELTEEMTISFVRRDIQEPNQEAAQA